MRWSRLLSSLKSFVLVGCVGGSSSAGSCHGLAVPLPARSAELTTDRLSPSMSAQSYGTGLHVYAALLGGVELSASDSFTASENGGAPVALARENEDAGDPAHYTTTFPENASPADIVIALDRTTGGVSAPRSEVIVPPSFTITSTAPASIAFGDRLPIAISPPPGSAPAPTVPPSPFVDAMSITASGPCLSPSSQGLLRVDFDAQGNAAFDTSLIAHPTVGTGGCDVSIEVRHETRGPFDPAFTPPDAGSTDAGVVDAAAALAVLADSGIVWALVHKGVEGLQSRSFTVHFAR